MAKIGCDKATAAKEMGVEPSTVSRICAGKFPSISDRNAERITKWLARHGVVIPEANVTVITGGFRRVRVYGIAEASGAHFRLGDLVPDNEYDLPTILAPDDGRRYVGFKVEGDSMLPTLKDGMTVLCDCDAELVNGCVVVAKWDDCVAIKRYRRIGDTILLTSDNPAAGKDHEIHASALLWRCRVIEFRGTL